MQAEQINIVIDLVSAATVVASLIFVGIQLDQNTKAVRASTSQAHAAMYHAIISSIVDDAVFARIWRNGLDDPHGLSADDQVRFISFASAVFRFYETSFVQRRRGQLDAEHWYTIERQAMSLKASPGIAVWWNRRRQWHSAKFQEWFDMLAVGETKSLFDLTQP